MTRTPRKKEQSAAQDRLDHIEEAQDVIDEARAKLLGLDRREGERAEHRQEQTRRQDEDE